MLRLLTGLLFITACTNPTTVQRPAEVDTMALAGLDTMMPRVRPAEPDTAWWRIPDSLLGVAGIALGNPRDRVIALHGSPRFEEVEVDSVMSSGDTVRVMHYEFGSVTLYGGGVEYVDCESGPCPTFSGINIGDTRTTVVARYGRGTKGYDPSEDVLLYTGQVADCGITFYFTTDRVKRIHLWCDNS